MALLFFNLAASINLLIMRRLSTPVFAMLLAVGFVAYLAHLHFTSAKRIESLYTSDSSDDPTEQAPTSLCAPATRNNQLPYNMRAREMALPPPCLNTTKTNAALPNGKTAGLTTWVEEPVPWRLM